MLTRLMRYVCFCHVLTWQRPITVNFGMNMPGWYDIASLEDINQREDKNGLLESQRCVPEGHAVNHAVSHLPCPCLHLV